MPPETEVVNPLDEMLDIAPESENLLTGNAEDTKAQARDVQEITQDDRERTKRQESLSYPQHFSGLNLSWHNASSINVSTGSLGIAGELFQVETAIDISVGTSVVDGQLFAFLAAKNDDRTKIRGYVSRDAAGSNPPDGFRKLRRIGLVLTDSAGGVLPFVQCGEYWQKRYTLRDSLLLDDSFSTVFTLVSGDGLPDGICSFRFQIVYDKGAGNVALAFYATPELLDGESVPSLANSKLVFATTGKFAVFEFDMERAPGLGIWFAATPAATTDEINLRGYTDDLS